MISFKDLFKSVIQNFLIKRIYSILFLSYLLLASINLFLPFSDLIKSIIVLPSFLLLPLQFGFGIIIFWYKLTNKKLISESVSIAFIILSWCVGIVGILFLSVVLVPSGRLDVYIVLYAGGLSYNYEDSDWNHFDEQTN